MIDDAWAHFVMPPEVVEWVRIEEQKYSMLLSLADTYEIPHEIISRWMWTSQLTTDKALELLLCHGEDAIPDDCVIRVCEGD